MQIKFGPAISNSIKVRVSDIGSLQQSGVDPILIHGDGIDAFQFDAAANGDILVFDSTISKFKNVPLSGGAAINTSGVMTLLHIDGGSF